MNSKVTVPGLQAMKQRGEKIVGVVAWDYQIARIVDRAGVDLVSVGDTVGVNLWGQSHPLEITMDQMIVVCQAVRRGVKRALVSCDFPFGPLQEGTTSAVKAAIRFVKEAGVDVVKVDGASDFLDSVAEIQRAGIPVIAQFGITPQTALRYGVTYSATPSAGSEIPAEMTEEFIGEARRLEAAGASMLNFT
ncbi:MAG: 3-methyl-2-oxobutanoate hydroxymethyltransferase, partial [Acidimicrobiaceae bacterium]|nr:3-methyl-2-oxobutanoate hydroxymethyltransferase [Acidimicrobiaceae bacterium]